MLSFSLFPFSFFVPSSAVPFVWVTLSITLGVQSLVAVGWTHWGRESLAMQFPMGPSADPDSVLQMVGTVCHLGLRAQVSSLGRTP